MVAGDGWVGTLNPLVEGLLARNGALLYASAALEAYKAAGAPVSSYEGLLRLLSVIFSKRSGQQLSHLYRCGEKLKSLLVFTGKATFILHLGQTFNQSAQSTWKNLG